MDFFLIALLIGILFVFVGLYFKFSTQKQQNELQLNQVKNQQNDNNQQSSSTQKQKNSLPKQDYGNLIICYGSQSGTAAKYSNQLAQEALELGFQAEARDLQDYKEIQFKNNLVLFLMATYGEGDPTDNAKDFYQQISKQEDNQRYQGLRFSVFGLGNSQYENYNAMGQKTNETLEKIGGQRIYKYGQGDDNCSLEEDFEDWKKNLWQEVTAHAIQFNQQNQGSGSIQLKREQSKSKTQLELEFVQNQQPLNILEYKGEDKFEYDFQTKKFFEGVQAQLIDVQEVRQNNKDGSTLNMIISLQNTNIQYTTAQNLAIFIENDPNTVRNLANYLNLNLKDVVTFQGINDQNFDPKKLKLPFPVPITVNDILTYFCDFQGPIMKRTLKEIVQYIDNQEVRQYYEHLASTEGKDKFAAEIEQKKVTIFDILRQNQIKLDLLQFIKLVPRISPRLYTISSSNKLYPDQIHVTASMQYDQIQNNQVKVGLASQQFERHFRSFKQQKFYCRIQFRESSFKLPSDQNRDKPIIMIGPGTGLAPFRAFLQENDYLIKNGQKYFTDMTLYFGCKYQYGDYIFKNELQDYLDRKVLHKLYNAFSRDNAYKVYVQDIILKNKEEIFEQFSKGATIYLCGSTAMGKSVNNVLIQIFQEKLSLNEDQAKKMVRDLEDQKRIIKELW